MRYYVYALIDPRDNLVKYIGKGSGNRMFMHTYLVKNSKIYDNNFTKFNALKQILTEYEDIAYCKFFETDDEEEAYKCEEELILEYHTLMSDHKGGWNLILGRQFSEEIKKKMSDTKNISDANKGENHYFFGKTHSAETKKKISESLKGRISGNSGKKHSEETKKKMSDAKKGEKNYLYGKNPSEETKKKMSESAKGHPAWNKGVSCSEETKKKISNTLKRRTSSAVTNI